MITNAPSALQLAVVCVGVMASVAVLGVAIDMRKRDSFRAYWWGRLTAWGAANCDAAHHRKSRHAMYLAVIMSRVDHKDGELEPWGGASAPNMPTVSDQEQSALVAQAMMRMK